jgi:hypothetical protein
MDATIGGLGLAESLAGRALTVCLLLIYYSTPYWSYPNFSYRWEADSALKFLVVMLQLTPK